MKGHEGIIKLRLKGKRPELILLDDFLHPSPMIDWEGYDSIPTVCVHGCAIEGLDLRFLIGCRVSVTSHDLNRAKRLFNACKAAKAQWVGASHTEMHGERVTTGWMEFYFG